MRTNIPLDGHTEGQADRLQLGEHQITPLPFEKAAVTEQTPIVAFVFGFGDEPCPSTARVEILDEHFGVQTLPILRADGMTLEFRENFFCKQLHDVILIHTPEPPGQQARNSRRSATQARACLLTCRVRRLSCWTEGGAIPFDGFFRLFFSPEMVIFDRIYSTASR